MTRSRYPSDLTDEQWAVLAPNLLRPHGRPGRPKGYTGPTTRDLAEQTGIDIEIVSGPKPPPCNGFLVQPRRWVVERTHAWINRSRRLVRQWEATLVAHTGFLTLSQIALLLSRRLAPQFVDRL